MRNRTLLLLAVTVVTGLAFTASSATANDGTHSSHASATTAAAHAHHTGPAPSTGVAYLAAGLRGSNEVPPADADGRGDALVRIQGTQVCFTTGWSRIGTPTAGHIHIGAAGANGPVVVGFFMAAMPATVHTATGCVSTTPENAAAIRANPAGYYVNLHNAEFPGGAIRGQLRALDRGVDLLAPFRRGSLIALCDGGQEVPAADPDGHAVAFVRIRQRELSFGVLFGGIAPPTAGHIHTGQVGVNGPIAVGFFTTAIPPTIFGVAGTVPVDRDLGRQISARPSNYYVNLHNAEFPGGAVRGQLFRAG
jgi:hypothetical protein